MTKSTKHSKWLLLFVLFITFICGCNNLQGDTKKISKEKIIIKDTSLTKKDNSTSNQTVPASTSNSTVPQKNSGLLMGLSKDNEINKEINPMKRMPNNYRTLWISKINDKIAYSEKKEAIITPYKNGFYKITNNKFLMTDLKDGSDTTPGDIYKNSSYYNNFSNIVSHAADKPIKNLLTEEAFKNLQQHQDNLAWSFNSQTEWLWYVGNKYACVMDYNFATGGGTLKAQWSDYKLYDLANLTSLDGRKNSISLVDLLDEKEKVKLDGYCEKYNKIISSDKLIKEEQKIDIKNIVLTRKEGRWQVLFPLYTEYQHNGNGSTGRTVGQYINTDIKLPKAITSYDDLCMDWSTIKQKYPEAKDAVSSPNKDMLAVLTSSKLLVFKNPEKGLENPALIIDVDCNESIILNQWSTGDYVEKWDNILKTY